jgi:hypothetical protein
MQCIKTKSSLKSGRIETLTLKNTITAWLRWWQIFKLGRKSEDQKS